MNNFDLTGSRPGSLPRLEPLPRLKNQSHAAEQGQQARPSLPENWVEWLPPILFLVTGGLTIIGAGGVVRYLYPLAAALVALVLYWRAPVSYVSLVWWLWFISPFVRRFVDYRSGWADPSPMLLAPPLATLVCAFTLFRRGSIWRIRTTVPFVLVFAGAAYGLLIGLIRLPVSNVATSALSWLTPLLFGFHLYRVSKEDPNPSTYMEATRRVFCWGLLVMGAYSLIQFVLAPNWDQMWMRETGMTSIGTPEPFGIRVFSTMNAPGPFGAVIAAGLLLLMSKKGALGLLATVAGYVALILSQARSAWLIWAVATAFILLRSKGQLRRVVFAVLLVGCSLLLLQTNEKIWSVVQTRFESMTDLGEDVSYQERHNGYDKLVGIAEREPFGRGMGVMDVEFGNETGGLGPHDSGLLEIFLSFGWFGGAAYMLGLAALVPLLFAFRKAAPEAFLQTAFTGVVFAFLSQFILGSFMLNVSGLVLWGFAGLALSQNGELNRRSLFPQGATK